MQKKRQLYSKEIRRREKDSFKQRSRMKLISRRIEGAPQHQAGSLLLNKQFEWISSMFPQVNNQHAQTNNCFSKLSAEIHEVRLKYMDNIDVIEFKDTPQQSLVAISHYLTGQNTLNHIQIMLQCFQQCLKVKNNHIQQIQAQEWEMDKSQKIIKWSSAFHMTFLTILHFKTMKVESLSSQLQNKFEYYFDQWLQKTYETFQVLVEQQLQFNPIHAETITQALKEIYQFCMLGINRLIFTYVTKTINERMIKGMHKVLISHKTDLCAKVLATSILLQIAKAKITHSCTIILASEFLQAFRFFLVFETTWRTSQKNDQIKNEQKIIRNILEFILEISYLQTSDIFWQRGIVSQLRQIQRQGVNNKIMHQDIITIIFVCITTVSIKSSIEIIQESNIFQWVLNVIKECIQCRYYDPTVSELLVDGITVIKWFIQFGQISKISQNPYIIKLRYCYGANILEGCVEGIEFLQQIGWTQQYV